MYTRETSTPPLVIKQIQYDYYTYYTRDLWVVSLRAEVGDPGVSYSKSVTDEGLTDRQTKENPESNCAKLRGKIHF